MKIRLRLATPVRPFGAIIAAGLIGAGATVGAGMYSSSQQKKAASANAALANGVPAINVPEYPDFIPNKFGQLNKGAITHDKRYYHRSDKDFAKRHGGMVQAEKLFEDSVLRDQKGESELMPALQREFVGAGLESALGAFGGDTGTLAPGSAGEANVATNLGLDIMGFQDRNRANRERSLALGENLFQRRQIGMSGQDKVAIKMGNTAGRNRFNEADYAAQLQAEMLKHGAATNQANVGIQQNNANASADAAMAAAIAQGIGSVATTGANAYGRSANSVTRPTSYTAAGGVPIR